MPNLRLTKEAISRIIPPEKGEVFYWDTKYKGFGLRVKRRKMMYVVQARVIRDGRSKLVRINVGLFGVLTAEQAETRAKGLLAQIALGQDPTAVKRQSKARETTLGEMFDEYFAVKKLRPKTRLIYEGCRRRCFGDWLDMRIVDINKDMVQRRHREISDANGPRGKGEAQANQAMRVLRAVLNYASATREDENGRPVLLENPVKRLTQIRAWNKIPRRQDIIYPHELPLWYRAVMDLENATMRDYFLLCLFTGLRRSEAAQLKWKNLDFWSRTITVPAPDTKANREHRLPMPDYLYDLLMARSRVRRIDNDYVFPAQAGSGYMIEPKRSITNVIRQCGVRFTMHTLRRTFVTTAERLCASGSPRRRQF